MTTTTAKRMRWFGAALFALSFVTPNWDLEGFGFGAFVMALTVGFSSIFRALEEWRMAPIGLALLFGFAANFTVYLRLSRWMALAAIAAPWVLLTAMVLLANRSGLDLNTLTFVPFYPWAIGIALIHLANLMEGKKGEPVLMEPVADGFSDVASQRNAGR